MKRDVPPAPTPRTCSIWFTLRGLMVLCFYTAFVLAALLRPSPITANFLSVVTVCLLVAAVVASFETKGPARAFAAGFAVFGWAYLAITSMTGTSPTLMTTSRVLYWLQPMRLPLQDYPAYYTSCGVMENVVFATLGGALVLAAAALWRIRPHAYRSVNRIHEQSGYS